MLAKAPPQRPGRLIAFSDGVVAIALTVLILPLTNIDLGELGDDPIPQLVNRYSFLLVGFAVSWFVIISFWMTHHQLFSMIGRVDSPMMHLNLLWLFGVVVFPFPASLLGQTGSNFDTARLVMSAYAVTLLFISVVSSAMWWRAHSHRELLNEDGLGQLGELQSSRGLVMSTVFVGCLIIAQFSPGNAPFFLFLLFAVDPISRPLDRRLFGQASRTRQGPPSGNQV